MTSCGVQVSNELACKRIDLSYINSDTQDVGDTLYYCKLPDGIACLARVYDGSLTCFQGHR